jgi:hypothetical protein
MLSARINEFVFVTTADIEKDVFREKFSVSWLSFGVTNLKDFHFFEAMQFEAFHNKQSDMKIKLLVHEIIV